MHDSSNPAGHQSGVRVLWDERIPMRDGAKLHALLYLPVRHVTPSPTLFTLTPYVAQRYHDEGVYFATHGYPFLCVDVRGRGNSEGAFEANRSEAQDGHDIVEWIARQSYCNGQVAMWGGSFSGYVQWSTASECPPHLSTIVPFASPYRGVDSPAPGNIFLPYRIQWLNLIAGRASQDKIFADQAFWNQQFRRWFESGTPFKDIDTFLGFPSSAFQEWLAHPERDAYWDRYNPGVEQYSKISLPILTITGSYDVNQLGSLEHYRRHLAHCVPEARARHYLVIGPWDHAGTRLPRPEFGGLKVGQASLVDLYQLHLQWYAWTMQNGEKPAFLKKHVAYYVMGTEKWRHADSLENVTARVEPYYLHSRENPTDVMRSGILAPALPGTGGPDHYRYDPRDLSLAALESAADPASLVDQRMIHAAAGKHLVYHSAPFEHALEVSGFFKLSVWLAIDQPDTDFRAAVYEVAVDGSTILLSSDVLRARYRESLREARLIRTTEPLRYDFGRFPFISRQIAKRSRLRLVIGPIHSIHSQRNYNSGGVVAEESMEDARIVTVKLLHDAAHPSALYVPIGQPEGRERDN